MSDTEQRTPNKTGASGAAWIDAEKIAYLIVLCEHEGKVESKIASAPIPAGRSIVSCKKLLWRLKEKHKDDIEKIKAGQALSATSATGYGKTTATSEKPKTPRKRKAKAEIEGDGNDDAEGSPKKKTGGRKKKGEATPVKEEAKEEINEKNVDDEMWV